MVDDPREAKARLRRQMRDFLAELSPESVEASSKGACDRILQLPLWRDSHRVLLFMPIGNEINVTPVLYEAFDRGKTVCLPRWESEAEGYQAAIVTNPDSDLAKGRFGIPEPKPDCQRFLLKDLDLILVPGLAFDLGGRRLGRGKGYYDRLLSETRGIRCGICYDRQLIDTLPSEAHDIGVEIIVTPGRSFKSE